MNQTEIRALLAQFDAHDRRWQQARINHDIEEIRACVAEFKQLCESAKQKPQRPSTGAG